MAPFSQTVHDGAAIEKLIEQRFIGNSALIEAELDKAKLEVERSKVDYFTDITFMKTVSGA